VEEEMPFADVPLPEVIQDSNMTAGN
jgi:hypothetical protein